GQGHARRALTARAFDALTAPCNRRALLMVSDFMCYVCCPALRGLGDSRVCHGEGGTMASVTRTSRICVVLPVALLMLAVMALGADAIRAAPVSDLGRIRPPAPPPEPRRFLRRPRRPRNLSHLRR